MTAAEARSLFETPLNDPLYLLNKAIIEVAPLKNWLLISSQEPVPSDTIWPDKLWYGFTGFSSNEKAIIQNIWGMKLDQVSNSLWKVAW